MLGSIYVQQSLLEDLGLGIFYSNIASLGKYVWAIASKQDSVRIKWVHSVYLKEEDWWYYAPNIGASWYWKRICNVKEQLKQFYSMAEMDAMSSYSIRVVYEKLMGNQLQVAWDKIIWNGLNVSKHKFLMWLAIQQKLQTTSKLFQYGTTSVS